MSETKEMNQPNSYLMETPFEAQRLEDKTDLEMARKQLLLMGLKSGDTAVDIGSGTGAVAREMSRIVGNSGKVVAFDASASRLEYGSRVAQDRGLTNIEFVNGDIYDLKLDSNTFDFVWCRFVFEYLEHVDLASQALWKLVKPNGFLVIGDLDGNMVFHDGLDDDMTAKLHRLVDALSGRFDPFIGRKLYRLVHKLVPKEIFTQIVPYHVFCGEASERDIRNWQKKVEAVSSIGKEMLGEEEFNRFSEKLINFLKDDSTFTYSSLIMVRGQK